MKFFKKLFSKKDKNLNAENKVFFHEDLFCQVEIVPRENSVNIEIENDKITDFAKDKFNGVGFSDIYERGEQIVKTNERKINISNFDKLVTGSGFNKTNTVYTGFGSFEEVCNNTIAFELDGAVIYYDFKEDNVIDNIWLDGFRFNNDSKEKERMIDVLYQIGRKWNLILNDWDLCEKIDLEIEHEIRKYIEEK